VEELAIKLTLQVKMQGVSCGIFSLSSG